MKFDIVDLSNEPQTIRPGWRLDKELVNRLYQVAAERNVGVVWVVERLLTESLERLIPAEEFSLTRPKPPAPLS